MKIPFDQSLDTSNYGVYTLLNGIDLPMYVKEAELEEREELLKNAAETFADIHHKWYPMNSPANVYVSQAFFNEKKAELTQKFGQSYVDEVQSRLSDAATMFGITDDLNRYQQVVAERREKQAKVAEPIVSLTIDDVPVTLWPVKTAEEFSKAANVFVSSLKKFPFAWRTKIAREFVEKASNYQVNELPDLLCKYAMMFYPDVPQVVRELSRRREKMANENYKERVNEYIQAVPNLTDKGDFMKIAANMHFMEQEEGLYDKESTVQVLPDIVDSLFTLSISKIAEKLDIVEMGGEVFDIADLQKVSADRYKQAFGFDVDPANSETLREVLPTMPRSDVALFKELTGIQPAA